MYRFVLFSFASLSAISAAFAEDMKPERPNFEVGIGAGAIPKAAAYNLDLTINIPLPSYLSAQLLLDSDYISGETSIGSYSQSEFSGALYLRNQYGRVGAALGAKQNKPKSEQYETQSTLIGKLSAQAYLDDFIFSAMYTNFDSDLENVSSSEVGFSYFPSSHRSIALYREIYDEEESWRMEMSSRYEEDDLSSIKLIVRDGTSDEAFYFALQYRYYFDSKYSLEERAKRFY